MSNANANLLNARVRRLDGTVTYINKVNGNGYSTNAKGPQIPVKRIVLAGKTLKEIESPLAKTEHVLIDGITVKLNKRQQKDLRNDEIDVDTIKPDFSSLVYIDPETGKPAAAKAPKAAKADKPKAGLKATRERNEAKGPSLANQVDAVIAGANSVAKRADAAKAFGMLWKDLKVAKGVDVVKALGRSYVRKALKALDTEAADLTESVDMLPSDKVDRKAELAHTIDATIADADTQDRRKMLSEAFDMDWKDVKKHGGKGVIKHMGRKAAQSAVNRLREGVKQDTFIKQMPIALKRLIQDGNLTLNKAQIERVLGALDLDVKFYDVAMQTLLGNLKLSLDKSIENPKVKEKKAKHKLAVPTYASEKEQSKRVRKMTIKLIKPPKKEMEAARAHMKESKAVIAKKLGIKSSDVKRGLICYKPNGVELMFVACDMTGPVFIEKDGSECVMAHANVAHTFNLTLGPKSELDAAV
ncbi:hypothetical protein MPK71_gp320 [Erwinia phage pEa_SNUABM_1]|uniref:Uncharacterized protein n=1 Tax=Erwinia phage pEa_SNUABM_1 TaxID=2869543 RepID=A0AAE7XM47_9CAUD|nr:hypothetical protein MPK71_gp320 [Erwinia phage pEa_SNUABM_1]QZE57529.1 hypothetical protein pEaSNUABM1_00320 [Erwinia phage pEa_SNUABM_1]